MQMLNALRQARRNFFRHRHLPWHLLARKSARYGWERATAPWRLLWVDELGQGIRTVGRPRIENFGYMRIGDNTALNSLSVPVELCTAVGATLFIGSDSFIDYGVSVGATGFIQIGNRVHIGPYTMIVDTDFHDAYNRAIRPAPSPVMIEDDVWIGAKVSIMPGVHIGRGAVISTGAVVTRDVPDYTVVAGVPARVVKTLDAARLRLQERV